MDNWLSVLVSSATVIGAVATLYPPAKDFFHKISSQNQKIPTTLPVPPIEQQTNRYQEILGQRHKRLREDILGLSLKEISNFYDFETTLYLKKYEEGVDELPNESIEKLVKVFFINPEYIQEGKNPIFRTFDIRDKQDDCRHYLEQDFKPCFLCSPNFTRHGCAYLVFWKEDKGYQRIISSEDKGYLRMIVADNVNSFYSSGRERTRIIYSLIYAMLDLNLNPDWLYIPFLNIGSDEWEKLSHDCWYSEKMGGYVGTVNNEAQDIFERWFKQVQEKRKNF